MASFRRFLRYMKPYLGRTIAATIMLAVAGGLMSLVVATVKPLVKEVLMPAAPAAAHAAPVSPAGAPGRDLEERATGWLEVDRFNAWIKDRAYFKVPVVLIVVFCLRAVFLYFGGYLTNKVGASVIRDLRADLYASVTFQSLKFFQANPTGVVLSRILHDVGHLQRVTTFVLSNLFQLGTQVPFVLIVMFVFDWRMSLYVLGVLALLAYPTMRLGKRMRGASKRSQESMAEAASLVAEAVTGAKVVQGFAMERFEIARFRAALERMLKADLKGGRASALAPAVTEFVAAFACGAFFWVAGLKIHQAKLDAGNFAVVVTGLGILLASIRRFQTLNAELQQAFAAATRVFDMMDREREIRDASGAVDLPPFRSEIRFDDVDFAYEEEKVLDRIRLTLRKGEVVALVGESGSGKSTIANLVPRFYDPTAGRILLDGMDVRQVTLASLRSQIGIVTQETVLFDDTVRNNVAYGRADVPVDRVVAAARAAHAHEFIEALPQGYDTVVGERGTRLSMGQRQRLTIARALLKDPPILILDEATSALDSESEMLVQTALDVLMQGRTSIVIAHRLSTIRRADRIVVLDGGRIVEEGTHAALLSRGGVYARLHALQFRDSPP